MSNDNTSDQSGGRDLSTTPTEYDKRAEEQRRMHNSESYEERAGAQERMHEPRDE